MAFLFRAIRACCFPSAPSTTCSENRQKENPTNQPKSGSHGAHLTAGHPRRVHVVEYFEDEDMETKNDKVTTSKKAEETDETHEYSLRGDSVPTPRPVGHSTSIYITAVPSEWQEDTHTSHDDEVLVSSPTHPHYKKRIRNFQVNPTSDEAAQEKRRSGYLLPPQSEALKGRKTLVLDLDETLVHSSFEGSKETADFILSICVQDTHMNLYVRMRPFLTEFLQEVYKHFELVIFTASMLTYADPVIDLIFYAAHLQLLPETHRLFRESCDFDSRTSSFHKNLSSLGRDLLQVIIVDNSPTAYSLNPYNAIPIPTWIDDENDRCLLDILPVLKSLISVNNVQDALKQMKQANEELEREEQNEKHHVG
eukprot:jgi/Galph1/4483/GphlegSOOS_G3135.1